MRGSAISDDRRRGDNCRRCDFRQRGYAGESAPPAPGNHNESLEVGAGAKKMTRTFIVHVPPGFDGKSKVPVVIMLHGAGGSGEGAIGRRDGTRSPIARASSRFFPTALRRIR